MLAVDNHLLTLAGDMPHIVRPEKCWLVLNDQVKKVQTLLESNISAQGL